MPHKSKKSLLKQIDDRWFYDFPEEHPIRRLTLTIPDLKQILQDLEAQYKDEQLLFKDNDQYIRRLTKERFNAQQSHWTRTPDIMREMQTLQHQINAILELTMHDMNDAKANKILAYGAN